MIHRVSEFGYTIQRHVSVFHPDDTAVTCWDANASSGVRAEGEIEIAGSDCARTGSRNRLRRGPNRRISCRAKRARLRRRTKRELVYIVPGYEKQYEERGHEASDRGNLGHDVLRGKYDPTNLVKDRFIVGDPDETR